MNGEARRNPSNFRTPHPSSATPIQKRKLSPLSAPARHCPKRVIARRLHGFMCGQRSNPRTKKASPSTSALLLPLPLGEGWGEGICKTPCNSHDGLFPTDLPSPNLLWGCLQSSPHTHPCKAPIKPSALRVAPKTNEAPPNEFGGLAFGLLLVIVDGNLLKG
jgi:hypothetical protein